MAAHHVHSITARTRLLGDGLYLIIGGDGRKYGPADLATVRAWVSEGRLGPATRVQLAGTTDWKPASAFPELRLPASEPPPTPQAAGTPPDSTRAAPRSPVLWPVCVVIAVLLGFLLLLAVRLGTPSASHVSNTRALGPPIASPPSPRAPGSGEAVQSHPKPPEEGEPEAQYQLGTAALSGQGGRSDFTAAAKWFRKAAERGHTEAQFQLGLLYAQGRGVPRDSTEAAKWYRLAAEKGYAPAQHYLGHLYARGQGLETEYLEEPDPSAAGKPKGMPTQESSRSDYAEAAKWWRQAAEQGDFRAQFDLGWLYAHGRGVESNYVEAVNWYRKAAEQGNSVAQHWLGRCFLAGTGVAKDEAEAFGWFSKAAARGDVQAQADLARMYLNGRGVEKNTAEALKWYRKAADAGSSSAQNGLAWTLATSPDPTVRNGPLAVLFAEKAVQATRETEPGFLDTLAAAHAETGDFARAVAFQNHAIALLKDPISKQDYTARLKLYEAKTPYREEAKP